MMFYITKCPYCGKVYRKDWGIEKFYDYEDKKNVTVNSHDKCGAFIQLPINDVSYTRYEIPHRFRRSYLHYIEECVLDVLNTPEMPSEHEMLHQVVEYLNGKNGGAHSYTEIAANLGNIRTIIDIIVGQINLNDIWSKPLTEDVEEKLVFTSAICCD